MAERARPAPDEWLAAHADDLVSSRASSCRGRARTGRRAARRPPARRSSPTYLRGLGLEPDVFQPDEVAGAHGARARGGRAATTPAAGTSSPGSPGTGGGRSLLFTGHVDVVPAHGEGAHAYWDGEVAGRPALRPRRARHEGRRRLLPARAALPDRVRRRLAGDLIVETTVDEEFGGANGTLACRLRGYNADGAVLTEPTGLARRATPPAAVSSTACTRAAARPGWTSAAAPRRSALVTLAAGGRAWPRPSRAAARPSTSSCSQSGRGAAVGHRRGHADRRRARVLGRDPARHDPRGARGELRAAVGRADRRRHAASSGSSARASSTRSTATRPRRS